MSEVVALASRLIERASLSPDEAGTLALVSEPLARAGFRRELELTPNGTSNAIFSHGRGEPRWAWAGHVDVVPAGDESRWSSPPFRPALRDGFLYGRGAADMKGSVAAATLALARLAAARPDHPGTLILILTSDEEGDAEQGTVRAVETLRDRGELLDGCLVGEPTCRERFGDTVKNGRRGSLNGCLDFTGRQGHVAYPDRADNALHRALPALSAILSQDWGRGNEYFAPTGCQLTNIAAGVGADNVVPGSCQARLNFRYGTDWSAAALRDRVEEICRSLAPGCRVSWKESAAPFASAPGPLTTALRRSVAERLGIEPRLDTGGGTSDARFLRLISAETIEFGPLNDTIHAIDERVAAADLDALADILEQTFRRLLDVPGTP